LFGYLLIANGASSFGLRWNLSAFSGGLVLGLIMTPIIARVTELSLRDVPLAMREASLALGATRWDTMRRVVLRVGLPGIVTGILLALTNALGQTVALIFVNGYTSNLPHWPLVGQNNNVTDMGSMIYVYLNQPSPKLQPPAEAAVIVLLIFVLSLSLLSRALLAVGGRTYGR
jgi:phosphate transport system permease protein